uniref:Ig-like domain-containing protein n=1 Tax=Calidris pygmaea TaxID=425635 RepID=A0A8C3KFI9_9CHAR
MGYWSRTGQVEAVTLHPPSREDFEGPHRNSTLLCQYRGPQPLPPTPFRWLKNGVPLAQGVTTHGPVADGQGGYLTSSRATVTEEEWDAGTIYTCQAEEEGWPPSAPTTGP